MRRLIITCLLAGLGFGLMGCSSLGTGSRFAWNLGFPLKSNDRVFSMARLSERHGGYEEAARLYEGLLEKDPQNGKACHRLGCLAVRRGQHDEGLVYFRRASSCGENSAELFNDMGYVLYLKHDLITSEKTLREALRKNPQLKGARNNLGLVLAEKGDHAEALAEFRAAGGEASAYSNLAYVQTKLGQLTEAEKNYHRALELDPKQRQAAEALVQFSQMGRKIETIVSRADNAQPQVVTPQKLADLVKIEERAVAVPIPPDAQSPIQVAGYQSPADSAPLVDKPAAQAVAPAGSQAALAAEVVYISSSTNATVVSEPDPLQVSQSQTLPAEQAPEDDNTAKQDIAIEQRADVPPATSMQSRLHVRRSAVAPNSRRNVRRSTDANANSEEDVVRQILNAPLLNAAMNSAMACYAPSGQPSSSSTGHSQITQFSRPSAVEDHAVSSGASQAVEATDREREAPEAQIVPGASDLEVLHPTVKRNGKPQVVEQVSRPVRPPNVALNTSNASLPVMPPARVVAVIPATGEYIEVANRDRRRIEPQVAEVESRDVAAPENAVDTIPTAINAPIQISLGTVLLAAMFGGMMLLVVALFCVLIATLPKISRQS